MRQLGLFLARTAITAWVGAAILFVVVGISEVVYPGFDAEIRDQLVVIRFPWYYRFGITLLAVGLVGTLLMRGRAECSAKRQAIIGALIVAALIVLMVEYFTVYVRLVELVTPPGKPRTAEFMLYHKLSMWVNLGDLVLCIAAMGLLNWPAKPQASGE